MSSVVPDQMLKQQRQATGCDLPPLGFRRRLSQRKSPRTGFRVVYYEPGTVSVVSWAGDWRCSCGEENAYDADACTRCGLEGPCKAHMMDASPCRGGATCVRVHAALDLPPGPKPGQPGRVRVRADSIVVGLAAARAAREQDQQQGEGQQQLMPPLGLRRRVAGSRAVIRERGIVSVIGWDAGWRCSCGQVNAGDADACGRCCMEASCSADLQQTSSCRNEKTCRRVHAWLDLPPLPPRGQPVRVKVKSSSLLLPQTFPRLGGSTPADDASISAGSTRVSSSGSGNGQQTTAAAHTEPSSAGAQRQQQQQPKTHGAQQQSKKHVSQQQQQPKDGMPPLGRRRRSMDGGPGRAVEWENGSVSVVSWSGDWRCSCGVVNAYEAPGCSSCAMEGPCKAHILDERPCRNESACMRVHAYLDLPPDPAPGETARVKARSDCIKVNTVEWLEDQCQRKHHPALDHMFASAGLPYGDGAVTGDTSSILSAARAAASSGSGRGPADLLAAADQLSRSARLQELSTKNLSNFALQHILTAAARLRAAAQQVRDSEPELAERVAGPEARDVYAQLHGALFLTFKGEDATAEGKAAELALHQPGARLVACALRVCSDEEALQLARKMMSGAGDLISGAGRKGVRAILQLVASRLVDIGAKSSGASSLNPSIHEYHQQQEAAECLDSLCHALCAAAAQWAQEEVQNEELLGILGQAVCGALPRKGAKQLLQLLTQPSTVRALARSTQGCSLLADFLLVDHQTPTAGTALPQRLIVSSESLASAIPRIAAPLAGRFGQLGLDEPEGARRLVKMLLVKAESLAAAPFLEEDVRKACARAVESISEDLRSSAEVLLQRREAAPLLACAVMTQGTWTEDGGPSSTATTSANRRCSAQEVESRLQVLRALGGSALAEVELAVRGLQSAVQSKTQQQQQQQDVHQALGVAPAQPVVESVRAVPPPLAVAPTAVAPTASLGVDPAAGQVPAPRHARVATAGAGGVSVGAAAPVAAHASGSTSRASPATLPIPIPIGVAGQGALGREVAALLDGAAPHNSTAAETVRMLWHTMQQQQADLDRMRRDNQRMRVLLVEVARALQ